MEQGGLLILIVVMGGGIAYVADKVGKHLGKKRLSLFGLRPRHTAAVGTVLLGVIITLFTFLAIYVLSSSARVWMNSGPQGIRDKQAEIISKEDQIKQDELQEQKLSKANKDLARRNEDTSNLLKNGQSELKNEQSRYGELQGRTQDLKANISNLNKRVGQENLKIKSLGSAERISERKLGIVRNEEKRAEQSRNDAINESNVDQKKNLELFNTNEELTKQQTNLQSEIKTLENQRDLTQGELKKSQNALDEAKRQLGDVEAQLGDVQIKLQDTLAKLQEAERNADFYGKVSKTAFNQPLMYSKGEEIARLQVRANLSATAARNEITTLIRTARVDAGRKGAADADIYYHEDESGARISPQEIEQQLVSQISGVNGNQVLVACSSYNSFRTERVSLEILVMRNPMVFSAGQMIAESPIDANKGDKVIVSEISTFLRNKIRPKALAEGIIPPINSDVSIGEVSIDDLMTLVQRIRGTANRQVRLQVLAEGTTRAADSLRLTFRIR